MNPPKDFHEIAIDLATLLSVLVAACESGVGDLIRVAAAESRKKLTAIGLHVAIDETKACLDKTIRELIESN